LGIGLICGPCSAKGIGNPNAISGGRRKGAAGGAAAVNDLSEGAGIASLSGADWRAACLGPAGPGSSYGRGTQQGSFCRRSDLAHQQGRNTNEFRRRRTDTDRDRYPRRHVAWPATSKGPHPAGSGSRKSGQPQGPGGENRPTSGPAGSSGGSG
jgi:hypothetical protein